ncbi:uncharacterized protein LOC141720034 [Apium graveolens]|uniref:uncharacterized protein LOC141720034 n=1 Tax=Apium graveolens TaxID=4045 RepID=UPI003D7A37BE
MGVILLLVLLPNLLQILIYQLKFHFKEKVDFGFQKMQEEMRELKDVGFQKMHEEMRELKADVGFQKMQEEMRELKAALQSFQNDLQRSPRMGNPDMLDLMNGLQELKDMMAPQQVENPVDGQSGEVDEENSLALRS